MVHSFTLREGSLFLIIAIVIFKNLQEHFGKLL